MIKVDKETKEKLREKEEREEAIGDLLEEALQDLAADREEFINRRINHLNFSRTIFWLCVKSRKEDYIYASELAEFLKISQARSNQILNDFSRAGLLKKRFATSNLVEYWIEKEKNTPIIQKYMEKSQKTLGIKAKLTLKQEK